MKRIEEVIGKAAAKIAKEIEANIILSIEALPQIDYDQENLQAKIAIFKKVQENIYKKIEYTTKLKDAEYGSITPVKEVIIEAINKKYINKGDRIVCTQDKTLGLGYILFVLDIDETFFKISRHKLSEKISTDTIEAILNIAKEIAEEGREGKRIGTAFIIGDPSELSKYAKQLIINPFLNLEEKPKITDPKIAETIKEFAQLDGVFLINNEGEVLSAGTYIDIEHSNIDLPPGFGTKHRACCALTKETDSLAIVVSESGGKIRVIKNGRIILKI
jgi:DNA integrity scanning protein DisA with diadenylate cyclase activity